jgi:lipid II:glycine glycyltransferase (peptidoglycan interpeptide bridge formation enzyme)
MAWKDTLVYKHGCSDPEFSNLGGTAMVFWKAIQAAKADDLSWFSAKMAI